MAGPTPENPLTPQPAAEVSDEPVAKQASVRYPLVDLCRLLFAFGIIVFHEIDLGDDVREKVGYIGLFGFVLMLSMMAGKSQTPFSKPYLVNRLRRLLMPWGVWFGIYLIAELGKGLMTGGVHVDVAQPGFWLAGPSIHLWFLPFAFVVSILIRYFETTLPESTRVTRSILLSALGLSLIPLVWRYSQSVSPWYEPTHQWVTVLPSVLFGLAMTGLIKPPAKSSLSYFLMLGPGLIGAWVLWWATGQGLGWLNAWAITIVAVSLLWKTRLATPTITLLASTALGVYLVAPLFTSVLNEAGVLVAYPWAKVMVVLLLSMVVTVVLLKSRLKWLVS